MPERIVTGRDHPHEQLLCTWCVVAGVAWLINAAPAPNSLTALLPGWVLWAWNMLLLVGGAVGLAGAWWPRRQLLTGLQLERASMVFLTAGTCMYVVAIFAAVGWVALAGGGFLAAWAGSCIWRGLQIHRDIRLLRRIASRQESPLPRDEP